ncbi:HIT-type domain-containing protein [Aphelenchoides bicaudatus]|nr:HIT-type domain-containing protein [Aphelenchoides bicaudatus]
MNIESDQPQQEVEASQKRKRRDAKCEQCQINPSKYSCPKCAFRSCSVDCVKKHKELYECDGMPEVWQKVRKFTHFTPEVSIQDQRYFEEIQKCLHPNENAAIPIQESLVEQKACEQQPLQNNMLPRTEYLLQKSASFRRICLKIDAEHPIKSSRHEGFSDTIFWTVRMRFVSSKQANLPSGLQLLNDYASPPSTAPSSTLNSPQKEVTQSAEDGELIEEHQNKDFKTISEEENQTDVKNDQEVFEIDTTKLPKSAELIECFSCTVNDIPETVTIRTFLKQFVQPKTHGPVISRNNLDLAKMEPFLQAPDSCLVYMETIVNETTKYLAIDQSKTILENLRNRTVNGHPEFVVALNTDRFDFEQPTQSDLESIRPVFHRQYNNNSHNNRGRQRNTPYHQNHGGRGGHGGPKQNRGNFNQNRGGNQNSRHRGRSFQSRGLSRF